MGYVEELRAIVGHRPLIFVGSVVVLLDSQNRILLQERREPYGYWGLPGGLMELGESAEETARREVYEETRLSVGKLNLIDVFSGKDNFIQVSNGDQFYVVEVAYYTHYFSGSLSVDLSESISCRFFEKTHLPSHIIRTHQVILERFLSLGNAPS